MESDRAPVGSLLTSLSGRARSSAQAKMEFDESVVGLKRRYSRVLWSLLIPKAEEIYRWRMQLECGCVREIFTHGEASYPDQRSDGDPLTGQRLPMGGYWCAEHRREEPFRVIVEWVEAEIKEFPPDPEEPQYDLDLEEWAKLRHTEPHSVAKNASRNHPGSSRAKPT